MQAFPTRCLALAAATSVALLASTAFAQVYVRGDLGASWSRDVRQDFNNDLGTSPIFQVGIGYRLPWNLRTDLTVGYRSSYELDSSESFGTLSASSRADVTSLTALANVYYDFDLQSPFKPYLGAGIGLAYNDVDSITHTFNGAPFARETGKGRTSFAWALMGGVGYSVSPALTVDLGYRYLNAGEFKTSGSTTLGNVAKGSGDVQAHELLIGLRYNF